ncbi:MAG: hypothetical protein AAF333_16675 [Planctomycetota bacterium]
MVIRHDVLHIQRGRHSKIKKFRHRLERGRFGDDVLSTFRLSIPLRKIDSIVHERNSETVGIWYRDEYEKARKTYIAAPSIRQARADAPLLAAKLGLNESPEATYDSVWGQFIVPFTLFALYTPLLIVMYCIADQPSAPKRSSWGGKNQFFTDIAHALGPGGMLALIGGLALATLAWSLWSVSHRPLVDRYRHVSPVERAGFRTG